MSTKHLLWFRDISQIWITYTFFKWGCPKFKFMKCRKMKNLLLFWDGKIFFYIKIKVFIKGIIWKRKLIMILWTVWSISKNASFFLFTFFQEVFHSQNYSHFWERKGNCLLFLRYIFALFSILQSFANFISHKIVLFCLRYFVQQIWSFRGNPIF